MTKPITAPQLKEIMEVLNAGNAVAEHAYGRRDVKVIPLLASLGQRLSELRNKYSIGIARGRIGPAQMVVGWKCPLALPGTCGWPCWQAYAFGCDIIRFKPHRDVLCISMRGYYAVETGKPVTYLEGGQ